MNGQFIILLPSFTTMTACWLLAGIIFLPSKENFSTVTIDSSSTYSCFFFTSSCKDLPQENTVFVLSQRISLIQLDTECTKTTQSSFINQLSGVVSLELLDSICCSILSYTVKSRRPVIEAGAHSFKCRHDAHRSTLLMSTGKESGLLWGSRWDSELHKLGFNLVFCSVVWNEQSCVFHLCASHIKQLRTLRRTKISHSQK